MYDTKNIWFYGFHLERFQIYYPPLLVQELSIILESFVDIARLELSEAFATSADILGLPSVSCNGNILLLRVIYLPSKSSLFTIASILFFFFISFWSSLIDRSSGIAFLILNFLSASFKTFTAWTCFRP